MKRSVWFIGLLLCTHPLDANAGGFNIYEMGTRATALGGAFTATADDPSAVFYNPAALAGQASEWMASLNVSPLRPHSAYARAEGPTEALYPGAATGETVSSYFFPSGAYVGWRFEENWAAGFGFFTPFGLGVEWDDKDDFAGRSISTNAQIQGLYFSPVIAYRAHERVSLSVGVHAVKSHLVLDSIRTAEVGTGSDVANVIDVELEGTSNWTAGLAAAIFATPHDRVNVGINYKQGVTNQFENDDATFTQRLTGFAAVDAQVASQLNAIGGPGRQSVSGELDYPDILAAGIRVALHEQWSVMFDAVWFGWSTFDEVLFDFENAPDTLLEENYEDVVQLRAGVEYAHGERLRFMAGYVYDETPQPTHSISPLLPDANRNDYSIGVSWLLPPQRLELSGGYMLVDFDERSTVENGVGENLDGFDASYETLVHILSFGVTRRF